MHDLQEYFLHAPAGAVKALCSVMLLMLASQSWQKMLYRLLLGLPATHSVFDAAASAKMTAQQPHVPTM